jgi:mannobiose 2-epimerase
MNPNLKTLNTHLHLIEAITPYYQLTKDSIARERLLELILIQSNTVLQKNVGACRDKYQLDWTPIAGSNIEQINYGHDLENIWLLQETCQVLGLPNAILLDFYKTLFSYALQYGFDYQKGGFYLFGYYNSPAHYRQKVWWVQGEALVSALSMYHLTGETIYRDCFCQTLQWIISHQIDWEKGDWYSEISPQGKPSGNKAGSWKSPYHNGRAMLKCLELLQYLNLKNL